MAQEVTVCEKEPEVIAAEIAGARTSLTEKMETLEQGIMETLRGANAAVTESVESVRAAIETTRQTVHGAVHDTTRAMGWALDLPAQVRRHPWRMVGGALLLGLVVGTLVGRRRW